jgi:hypothetical protein
VQQQARGADQLESERRERRPGGQWDGRSPGREPDGRAGTAWRRELPGRRRCDHGCGWVDRLRLRSGLNGNDGAAGESFSGTFTSPNGEYSISVTDTGITLAHGINTRITLAGSDIELRTAEQATIQAGTAATVEAETNFTLKGQGAGRVEAGGALTLKGSVINQN